ncbi:hypothetical protein R5R35_011518 [Gryllus longicercus]|uniref:Major facilitator superfamily (MFS) profile domain-containing protein n=1 Tax=Gryllus longicercus TaxID=2509291 RepID=A0AAN9VBQ4_9ORTH
MTVTGDALPWRTALRQLLAVGAASLVFASAGALLVWPAAALPRLLEDSEGAGEEEEEAAAGLRLTAAQGGWVVAALHAGQVAGAAPGGLLAARVGRRRALLACAPAMLLAWLATAWAGAAWALLAARALGGVAVGVAFAAGPLYAAEATSARLRGAAGALPQLALSAGQLLAYCGGAWLSLRALALVAAALPVAFFGAFYAAPESPHWLLRAGRREDAARALRRLRGSGAAQEELDAELDAIEAFACAESAEGAPSGAWGEMRALFVDAAVRRALWIVLGMVGLQCMCGYTAFLAYSTVIFQESGDALDANHSGIVVGVILLVMCLISPVVVDRAGRRFCLLVSCSVAAVALLIEGGYFYAAERQLALADAVYWLPVVALVAFFIAFTLGLGPLPTTVAGELFPAHARGAAGTLVSVAIGAGGFGAAKLYQVVTDAWGFHVTMWMFGSVCVVGVWFSLAVLPETRGHSFQEIQQMLVAAAMEGDALGKKPSVTASISPAAAPGDASAAKTTGEKTAHEVV